MIMGSDSGQRIHSRSGPAAELLMALEHHKAGRLRRAEAHYRQVLRKVPKHPDALHLLGVIALDRGRPEQAIELIRKALAVQPNLAQAYSNLGNALLACGRRAEAIANYRRAIDLEPHFAVAQITLAEH